MANVNANINVLVNTSQASAQLRRLSTQLSALNRNFTATNAGAVAQQTALNRALMDGLNASGMFNARMVPSINSVQRFTNALEKNKFTLGQYTRYAASQMPGMRRVFTREWDMMTQVATDRVKKLQTQYLALGKTAQGMQMAMAATPTSLGKGFATDMAIASQRAQLFNRMIDAGSTKMLNWGKNTQWAGRQLMVGFTLPLAALGAAASKAFMEIDKATLALERVYGDLNTSSGEVERASAAIQQLGREYTKYGIAVKDTIDVAATAAATGSEGAQLMAVTEQTLRFATLGQIDYQQALDATIALQTAFGTSADDLKQKIDFLNAVENQTILTIEDMSLAIPRVASVVKGLGGDVEDLAVLMTAMREGGISAEQGANAIKSGLGRMINPTKAAREQLDKMGISIDTIIGQNKGDFMGLIRDFGAAISQLTDFEQQQTLQKVFGTYQYNRLGALFRNISNDSSQAARSMDLASMSAEELGQIADKELSKISDTTTIKFRKAVEDLKVSIAPLGEAFLKGAMPIVEALSKIAEAFNNLPDGVKNAMAVVTGVVAGLGPVFLMTIGLIGNGVANLIKGIQAFRKTLARIRGDASAFNYVADAELEAAAAAASLDGKTDALTSSLLLQQSALKELIVLYQRLAGSMAAVPGGIAARGPRSVITGPRTGGTTITGPGGLRMAKGGVVPGTGNKDTVPAMLTPGETVVTKQASQRYGPVIAAMNAGTLPGYNGGLDDGNPIPSRSQSSVSTVSGTRLINYAPGGFMLPGNRSPFGMDPSFIQDTRGMTQAIKVGLAAGVADIRGMTVHTDNIEATMLQFAGELDGDVPRIVTALQQTQDELASAGVAARNIDDLMQAARTRLTPILSEMTAAGGARADAARYFSQGHLDPTSQAAIARGEKRVITSRFATDTGQYDDWITGRVGGKSQHQRLSEKGWSTVTGEDRPAGRQYAHTASQKFLGGERETMGGGVVTKNALGSEQARQSAMATARGVETTQINRMMQRGGLVAAEAVAAQGPQAGTGFARSATPPMVAGMAAAGTQAGTQGGLASNKAWEETTKDGYVLMRDRGSPHALVAPDARSDATLYGNTFDATVKAAIMDGGPVPPMPGTTPADGAARGRGYASSYNQAVMASIMKGAPVPALPGPMPSVPTGILKSRKGSGNANARMEAAGLDEVQRRRILRKYGDRLDERSGRTQVADKARSSASNFRRSMRAVSEADRMLERGVRNFGRNFNAALSTIGTQTKNALSDAAKAYRGASGNVAEKQARRRAYGDIPLGGRKGVDDAFSRQGRGGGSVATLPYVPRGFGKIMQDEAAKMKAGFTAARQSTQGFSKAIASTARLAAQDIKKGFSGIGTQLSNAKTSMGKSFKDAAQGVRTGSSMLFQSMREAATKIRTSAAGGAGGGGGMFGFLRGGKGGGKPEPGQGRGARGAMGAGMALSMGSMVPFMMQDDQGKFAGMDANTLGMGMMGGGMLLSMVGMVPPQILALVAVIGVAAIAFKAFRDNIDKTAIRMAELGANIGGASNAVKNLSSMMGLQTPAERQKQVQMGLTDEDLASEQYGQFQNMLESESGQAFIKQLSEATAPERFEILQSYLQNAIASGLMDTETADLFGKTVASSLNDAVLGSAVPNMIKGVEQGSKQMIKLARSRDTAIMGTSAMQSVQAAQEDGGQVAYQDASTVIGASLQAVGDYANAAALASEEFTAGSISFQQYRSVVEEARDRQREYNQAISTAINQTSDLGGTMAALDSQLGFLGLSPEEVSAATAAAAPETSWTDTAVGVLANFGENLPIVGPALNYYSKTQGADFQHAERERQKALNTASMAQAIAGGMDQGQVTAMMDAINKDPESKAAQTFFDLQRQGKSGLEQFQMAGFVSSTEQGGVAGLETQQQVDRYIDVAVQYSEEGGTLEEFQTFFNTIPEEKKVDILATFEGLTPEQQKLLTGSYSSMQAAVGQESATAIMESDEYQSALDSAKSVSRRGMRGGNREELDRITGAVTEAGRVFGDNAENIVSFVLEQDPPNIAENLQEITENGKALAGLPKDMVANMGINIDNPEDINLYGPMAEDLTKLGGVIQSLPEDKKELAYNMMFDSNGKPKTPGQLLKDVQSMEKEFKKIDKQKDGKVKKDMIFEVTQTMYGADGSQISDTDFNRLYEQIEEDFPGITEELPSDVLTKTIMMQYNAEKIQEAASALREAGGSLNAEEPGSGDELIRQADTLDAVATSLQSTAAESVGAAASNVASDTGGSKGSGGGGGGEKKDPWKDFKNAIEIELKSTLDLEGNLNKLLKKKIDLFGLLKQNRGIDDKIRKAGLQGTALGEQIAGLSPEDATKVLNQVTGKGGRLNQTGRRLQQVALATEFDAARNQVTERIAGAGEQTRALATLQTGRFGRAGVGAISEIAGDPEKARMYNDLVEKAKEKEKSWLNAGTKNRKKAQKEWKEAQKAVADYVKDVENAVKAEREAEAQAAFAGDVATARQQQKEYQNAVGYMSQQGMDSELIQFLGDNEQYVTEANRVITAEQEAQAKLDNARNKKQRKAARQELNLATKDRQNFFADLRELEQGQDFIPAFMDPEQYATDKINEEFSKMEEEARKNFEQSMAPLKKMEAEFEVIFNTIEAKYKPLIEASKERIKGLQKEVEAIQDEIDAIQDLNAKDQMRVRSLERQKEMVNRQIQAVERQNELDQRRADALNRQAEMINRQVGVLERANELDQRRIDALNRQAEMIARSQDAINRTIEASERQNELDQRKIEDLSRQDELRQRSAEAINRELELMSRAEDQIRQAFDARIQKLDEIEKANQRIAQSQKDQLDLAQALAQGDIYAATAAAQQMKQNQIDFSKEQARTAMQQGMEGQVAALRTSGGLTREEAEGEVQVINDQSYQVQLSIRDINDQIYTRQQEMIPLRDQLYNYDLQIRDLNDQILIIQDQMYLRDQEKIPLLDEIRILEEQSRDIADAIYERNLNLIPLKDTIYNYDMAIRDVQDIIYERETQILGIQNDRLKPKQRTLELENRYLRSQEEALANEKATTKINGMTYDQLKDQMDALTDNYNLQVEQFNATKQQLLAAAKLTRQWGAVAKAIAGAVRTAKQLKQQADIDVNTQMSDSIQGIRLQKLSADETERRINAEKAAADAARAARYAQIDAERNAAIATILAGGTASLGTMGFYKGGMIKKYAAAGFVTGNGGRDSVLARLTPGEFVIRKSMVDKYGMPFMNDINTGSFQMPKYNIAKPISVQQSDVNQTVVESSSPVYNTYSVNVNVPNASINADEVANKVLYKIKSIDSSSVRGNRGF